MKIGKILYRLLIFFLVSTMLISGLYLLRDIIDALQQKRHYDGLAHQVAQLRKETGFEPSAAAPPDPTIAPEYAPLYEENADLVGWITIEDTPIDYPVMQTPDRKDYYLRRNFRKETSPHGCLYVRESCDVFAPSDNVTIYGHHMKDGSMFASLKKFRDQSFWNDHHTIRFDTLFEHHNYTVFAIFATSPADFPYHLFENAANESEFDDFITACKSLSMYDTSITPKFGDKLICLSTCDYSRSDGRLVVVAVRN